MNFITSKFDDEALARKIQKLEEKYNSSIILIMSDKTIHKLQVDIPFSLEDLEYVENKNKINGYRGEFIGNKVLGDNSLEFGEVKFYIEVK